jgi:hypothetical protein
MWTRDQAIEWALMVRRRSVSPTHGGPSGSKSRGMSGGDHGSSERGIVIHRITKEVTSNAKFPVLTKTNYTDWEALMRVMLQATGLWIVVSMGGAHALEVIDKAVPREDDWLCRHQGNGQNLVGRDSDHVRRYGAGEKGEGEHTPV